jgi:MFS family permease
MSDIVETTIAKHAESLTAPAQNIGADAMQAPRLLPLKVLYFFFFAGQGTFFTFINVYYSSIGLSGTQIGLINTVAPLAGMFSSPLWGMLSDRFGRTRRLLMLAVTGVIVATLLLSAAPSFGLIVPIVAVYALFNTSIMPLIDSTTLSLLGQHRERYGAQRVWGTVGFILVSAGVGYVVERTGLHSIFYGYTIAMACFGFALIWLPEQPVRLQSSLLHGLNKMVRQPPWLLFTASITLLGLATSGMANFLSIMVKGMGGSDSLIGLMWMVAALVEMPIMASSAPLLRRFGPARLLAVALLAYTLRMLLYGLMPTAELVAAVNVLGGVSFGLYWLSAVNYANELAPVNLKATSQGLFVATASLAGMLGAVLTGWLFDLVGPAPMFRILALCCVLALALFALGRLYMKRRARGA